MPKRSNDFQRLVRRLYRQLVPAGATVTESALVSERDTSQRREVDVLIEVPLADTRLRVAVECRDRSRPGDVEWIDALIGKYRDLAIDRIVAVARAGFTAGAQAKAKATNIETRTLRQALEADWPAELEIANVARIQVYVHPETIIIDSTPQLEKRQVVRAISSDVDMPIGEYFRQCHGAVYDQFMTELENDPDKRFGTIQDLNREHRWGCAFQAHDTILITSEGSRHTLNRMWWECTVELSTRDLPTKCELFGNVGVISANDNLPGIGPITTLRVQVPGSAPSKPVVFRPDDDD